MQRSRTSKQGLKLPAEHCDRKGMTKESVKSVDGEQTPLLSIFQM